MKKHNKYILSKNIIDYMFQLLEYFNQSDEIDSGGAEVHNYKLEIYRKHIICMKNKNMMKEVHLE